ncbi:hypothetical protein [Luteitalea sp.]
MRKILLTLCVALAVPTGLAAQPPAQQSAPPAPTAPAAAPAAEAPATPAPTVPAVPAALPMAGPTGMVFHAIKADKTADFESVMTRLRDLLAASATEARRQQGAGWRVFRQATPLGDGSVLYISFLEPVVANAEYDVPRLLAEAAPAEAAQLYEQFRDAHVQPTVQASNLTIVIAPGAAAPAAAAPAPPAPKP